MDNGVDVLIRLLIMTLVSKIGILGHIKKCIEKESGAYYLSGDTGTGYVLDREQYEEVLKRQLDALNSDYAMLQMQSEELRVRNIQGQMQLNAA